MYLNTDKPTSLKFVAVVCAVLCSVVLLAGNLMPRRTPEPPVVEAPGFWELLPDSSRYGYRASRTRVPGGWLVKGEQNKSMAFVPDREHQWKLE